MNIVKVDGRLKACFTVQELYKIKRKDLNVIGCWRGKLSFNPGGVVEGVEIFYPGSGGRMVKIIKEKIIYQEFVYASQFPRMLNVLRVIDS